MWPLDNTSGYNQRTNNRWMRPNAASNVINSERTSLRSKIAMESGPFILDHEKKMLIVHSYGSYVKLPGKTNSERTIVMSCDVLIQSRSTCNLGVPPNQSPGKQVLFPWHPKRSVHPKASWFLGAKLPRTCPFLGGPRVLSGASTSTWPNPF